MLLGHGSSLGSEAGAAKLPEVVPGHNSVDLRHGEVVLTPREVDLNYGEKNLGRGKVKPSQREIRP